MFRTSRIEGLGNARNLERTSVRREETLEGDKKIVLTVIPDYASNYRTSYVTTMSEVGVTDVGDDGNYREVD